MQNAANAKKACRQKKAENSKAVVNVAKIVKYCKALAAFKVSNSGKVRQILESLKGAMIRFSPRRLE